MPDGSYVPSVGLNPQVTPFNTNLSNFDPGMGRAAASVRPELFPLVRLANGLVLTQSVRESEARATEVANNASKQIGELMQSYQNLSNKDAVDNIGLFEKKLNELNDGYLKEIEKRGDPLASRLVKEHMNKLMLDSGLQARGHWLTETKNYQISELENAEKIAQDDYNKAYGTPEAEQRRLELNIATNRKLQAQGIDPNGQEGYLARLTAEDTVHYNQIKWLIDEERLGEAARMLEVMNPAKNGNSRMLMETWQKLHANLSNAQRAAAMRAAAAQELDFYKLRAQLLNKYMQSEEGDYVEEVVYEPQEVEQTVEAAGVDELLALTENGAAAAPATLAALSNAKPGEPAVIKTVRQVPTTVRRKRTQAEKMAWAMSMARQEYDETVQYYETYKKGYQAGNLINVHDLQLLQQAGGGQYIPPTADIARDLFSSFVRMNRGDAEAAQKQWDNVQGIGTGNSLLDVELRAMRSDPQQFLRQWSSEDDLLSELQTRGAGTTQLQEWTYAYRIAQSQTGQQQMEANNLAIRQLLAGLRGLDVKISGEPPSRLDGVELFKQNAAIRTLEEYLRTKGVNLATATYQDLLTETNKLKADGLFAMAVSEAVEQAERDFDELSDLSLTSSMKMAVKAAMDDGIPLEEALRIAKDPTTALHQWYTRSYIPTASGTTTPQRLFMQSNPLVSPIQEPAQ